MSDDSTIRDASVPADADAMESRTRDPEVDSTAPTEPTADSDSPMRSRAWVIAARFGDPTEYGLPEPPTVSVSRTDSGGIELSSDADCDPFVRADDPVPVRR